VSWADLLICSVAVYLTLWSGMRIWASQPARERLDVQDCHCICPECPEADR
jgi:hypothetical protein